MHPTLFIEQRIAELTKQYKKAKRQEEKDIIIGKIYELKNILEFIERTKTRKK